MYINGTVDCHLLVGLKVISLTVGSYTKVTCNLIAQLKKLSTCSIELRKCSEIWFDIKCLQCTMYILPGIAKDFKHFTLDHNKLASSRQ